MCFTATSELLLRLLARRGRHCTALSAGIAAAASCLSPMSKQHMSRRPFEQRVLRIFLYGGSVAEKVISLFLVEFHV